MTQEERHKKITEGVTQIGRLVGTCAKHEMTVSDIMTMLQTSTSLVCEMNNIDIADYMKYLYVLHRRRTTAVEYSPSEHSLNAELRAIFAAKAADDDDDLRTHQQIACDALVAGYSRAKELYDRMDMLDDEWPKVFEDLSDYITELKEELATQ